MSIRIAGTGSYVPEKVLTNADLEKMVETSDEWIVTRTGIHERRIAETEGTSVLAASFFGATCSSQTSMYFASVMLRSTDSPGVCFTSRS